MAEKRLDGHLNHTKPRGPLPQILIMCHVTAKKTMLSTISDSDGTGSDLVLIAEYIRGNCNCVSCSDTS